MRRRRRSAAPAKPKLHFVDGTFSCAGKPIYPPQIYNVSDEDAPDAPKPNASSEIIRRIISKQNPSCHRCLIILIPGKRELS